MGQNENIFLHLFSRVLPVLLAPLLVDSDLEFTRLELDDTSVKHATPEAKKKAVDAKAKGDEAFGRKEFDEAIDAYTQAIACDPTDATLYSDRSLCWIHKGEGLPALSDAKTCRALKRKWAKGCYLEGSALCLLKWFREAAHAFYKGVMLDPENMEMKTALWEAADSGRKLCGANNQFLILHKLEVLRERIMIHDDCW